MSRLRPASPPAGRRVVARLALRRPARPPAGFTLIELLVVAAILLVVTAVLGACIAAGVRVLANARAFNTTGGGAAMALELVEKDLVNTFPFYAIPFRGAADGAAFPGLVDRRERDGTVLDVVGTVAYSFDPAARSLTRRRWAFPPAEGPRDVGRDPLVGELRDAAWFYGELQPSGDIRWRRDWDNPTNHPAAVRIELAFGDRAADRVARLVVLPRAALPRKAPPPGGPPAVAPPMRRPGGAR